MSRSVVHSEKTSGDLWVVAAGPETETSPLKRYQGEVVLLGHVEEAAARVQLPRLRSRIKEDEDDHDWFWVFLQYPDSPVSPVLEQDSFRPLIGQLADESSAMERLLGRPSAHSSLIAQAASESLDQRGWDSTLSRMIGRLSHQPGSDWLVEPSWLCEEGSQMRVLVGEPDDAQLSRSSGTDGS